MLIRIRRNFRVLSLAEPASLLAVLARSFGRFRITRLLDATRREARFIGARTRFTGEVLAASAVRAMVDH